MIFISKNLELLRKRAGYKQAELANQLGVKANTISNYEKGVSQPDYLIISKLMKLFNVTSDQLLFSDLSMEDTSRTLIKEEVTESVFDKFLSKINERDRKLDEKDTLLKEKEIKIDQLQSELLASREELAALKEKIHQFESQSGISDSKTPREDVTESFTTNSYGDYGEGYPPMKESTSSKRSSAGKM